MSFRADVAGTESSTGDTTTTVTSQPSAASSDVTAGDAASLSSIVPQSATADQSPVSAASLTPGAALTTATTSAASGEGGNSCGLTLLASVISSISDGNTLPSHGATSTSVGSAVTKTTTRTSTVTIATATTTCMSLPLEPDVSAGAPGMGKSTEGYAPVPLSSTGQLTSCAPSSAASPTVQAVSSIGEVEPGVSAVPAQGSSVSGNALLPAAHAYGATGSGHIAAAATLSSGDIVDFEFKNFPDRQVSDNLQELVESPSFSLQEPMESSPLPDSSSPSSTPGDTGSASAARFEHFKRLMELINITAEDEDVDGYSNMLEEYLSLAESDEDNGSVESDTDDAFTNNNSYPDFQDLANASRQFQGVRDEDRSSCLFQTPFKSTVNQPSPENSTSQESQNSPPPFSSLSSANKDTPGLSSPQGPSGESEANEFGTAGATSNSGQSGSSSSSSSSAEHLASISLEELIASIPPELPLPYQDLSLQDLSFGDVLAGDQLLMPPPQTLKVKRAMKAPPTSPGGSPPKQPRLGGGEQHGSNLRSVSSLKIDSPSDASADQSPPQASRDLSGVPSTSGAARKVLDDQLEYQIDQAAEQIRKNLCTVKTKGGRRTERKSEIEQFCANFRPLLALERTLSKALLFKHKDILRQFLRYKKVVFAYSQPEKNRQQKEQGHPSSQDNPAAGTRPSKGPSASPPQGFRPSDSSTGHCPSSPLGSHSPSVLQAGSSPVLSSDDQNASVPSTGHSSSGSTADQSPSVSADSNPSASSTSSIDPSPSVP